MSWQPSTILESFSLGLTRRDRKSDSDSSMKNDPVTRSTLALTWTQEGTEDPGLVLGFRPLRDRYLLGCLTRMNHPVLQMFPEMDGYTAAIPSKRDLQTLVKSIQNELVQAVQESDVTLLRLVGREALKTLRLITSKVEEMILNTSEVKKVVPSPSFVKNHAQDHNSQLIVLLQQLKDAVLKLPEQVYKSLSPPPNNQSIQVELGSIFASSIEALDQLTGRQLLYPLLDNLVTYIKSVLMTLTREGVTSTTAHPSTVEPSKAIQTLTRTIPDLLQCYVFSLPKSPTLKVILEEFCLRLMYNYTLFASMIRPVNEYSRLRTSQDMSAIDDIIASVASHLRDNSSCPVIQEFKSFRRLLFVENDKKTSMPPSRSQILSLPYLRQIRPSVVLGYLISCSPAQCPSIHESYPSLGAFVEALSSEDGDSARNHYTASWKKSRVEQDVWNHVQSHNLDVFLQRISVVDDEAGASSKILMKAWYEIISSVGKELFTEASIHQ